LSTGFLRPRSRRTGSASCSRQIERLYGVLARDLFTRPSTSGRVCQVVEK